jgi:hypothetical protein
MRIKTIVHDNPTEFDEQVNTLLAQGYTLCRCDLVKFETKLYHYAMLEHEGLAEPQPVDHVGLARQLRDFCRTRSDCYECPMESVCKMSHVAPAGWYIPEEEEALEV